MPPTWTTYRLLCCAPAELENERLAFDAVNAKFAEQVTMPDRVLFALASPRPDFVPQVHGRALEANIRFCDFFAQFFGETAPDPGYSSFLDLAIACAADPSLPMRSSVVLFRNPENADAGLAALRRRLIEAGNCTVRDFHNPAELEAIAEEILTGWYQMIQDNRATSASPS